MNIKKESIWLLFLATTISVHAFLSAGFPGWDILANKSPWIVIAYCKKSPERHRLVNGMRVSNPLTGGPDGGIVLSDFKIVALLKGQNPKPKSDVTLWSSSWPYQGETYLIFATDFDGTNYSAYDSYRVVTLGHNFSTNTIAGKSLNDQIRAALRYRLDKLKVQIKEDQQEKLRLEEGLDQTNSPLPAQKSPS